MAKSHNRSVLGTNHYCSIKSFFFFFQVKEGPTFPKLPLILSATHSILFLKEEITFILILHNTQNLLPGIFDACQKPDCQKVGLFWKRKGPKASHGANPCANSLEQASQQSHLLRISCLRSGLSLGMLLHSIPLLLIRICASVSKLHYTGINGNRKKTCMNSWWDFV